MKQLNVVGVRVELPTNSPLVLLKEAEGERYLPIWIGPAEATAIAVICDPPEQQLSRPLTHDLFKDVLDASNISISGVEITELRDNVFYADLLFADGKRITARPSDAIALALRVEAPISCVEGVLDEAGILIPDADDPDQEDEVEKFREFLDKISPEDFGAS